MTPARGSSDDVDVIVIGGGVNGTGAARDLALRGLSVVLLEKRDFGSGATGASSGMIHGGVRYLLNEPKVTKLSCHESGAVKRIASHMMFRIPFITPFVPGVRPAGLPPGLALHGLDAMLYGYDLYQPHKGGLPHQRLSAQEAREIEPGLSPNVVGAATFDEWGIDANRLCLENALSAAEAGAEIHNHTEVIGFFRDGDNRGPIEGVFTRDTLTGSTRARRARAVLNATGPWSELVARKAGATVRLRPAKGIHLIVAGRVTNYAVAAQTVDDRAVFIEPWQDVTLIGNTDDDYYGDLDRAEANFDEVAYLLQAIETVFPSIREHRVIDTWVGIRPTLWNYGPIEDKLSREHRVFDHSDEGAPGLFSLAGGKLASFRQMAEDATDALCEYLGHDKACTTADHPLPGTEGDIEINRWATDLDISEAVLGKLARRYGSRTATAVSEACSGSDVPAGTVVCRCEQVLAAEIRHVIRHEWARTLGDVMRRTRLGTGQCGGARCAHLAAQVLAQEQSRDASWAAAQAQLFLHQRYRSRRPAINGFQARSEALNDLFLSTQASRAGGAR